MRHDSLAQLQHDDRSRCVVVCLKLTVDLNGQLKIWGDSQQVTSDARINALDIPSNVKRFLGMDDLVGYQLDDGHIFDLEGNRSALPWDDVVVTGLGTVYTYSDPRYFRASIGCVNIFQDLGTLLKTAHHVEEHQALLFAPGRNIRLYATESRVFVLIDGKVNHLYEVDYGEPGDVPGPPTFRSKDYLAGLRVSLVPGSRNRCGVITDAGDLCIMDTRSKDPELVELPEGVENVRLAGIGSKFDVIVTEDMMFVRGSSETDDEAQLIPDELGELGLPDMDTSDSWLELSVPCDPRTITAVHTSRSGTILEVTS